MKEKITVASTTLALLLQGCSAFSNIQSFTTQQHADHKEVLLLNSTEFVAPTYDELNFNLGNIDCTISKGVFDNTVEKSLQYWDEAPNVVYGVLNEYAYHYRLDNSSSDFSSLQTFAQQLGARCGEPAPNIYQRFTSAINPFN